MNDRRHTNFSCPNCGEEIHLSYKENDSSSKSKLTRNQWSLIGGFLVFIGPLFPWLWIPGFAVPGFRFPGTWLNFILGLIMMGIAYFHQFEELWNWQIWIAILGITAALLQMMVLVHFHPPTEEYTYVTSQISFGFYLTLIGYLPSFWYGSKSLKTEYS